MFNRLAPVNVFKPMLFTFLICWISLLSGQTETLSGKTAQLDSLWHEKYGATMPPIPPAPALPSDSLQPLSQLSDTEISLLAFQLAKRALELENAFLQKKQQAEYSRGWAEQDLKTLKTDDEADESEIETLENSIAAFKKEEKEAAKIAKKASKTADFALKISQSEPADMRKNLPKLEIQLSELGGFPGELGKTRPLAPAKTSEITKPAAEISAQPTAPADDAPKSKGKVSAKLNLKKKPKNKPENEPADNTTTTTPTPNDASSADEPTPETRAEPPVASTKKFKTYNPREDVMLFPPASPCLFLQNGQDDFSGELVRELKKEELFRYTPDQYKPFLKDQPYMRCEAALAQTGRLVILNLSFTVMDNNAKRAFGGFAQNGSVVLKLIDGTTFTLNCLRADEGSTDETNKTTVFATQFAIDRSLLRNLQKSEVDKLRVGWTKGYEVYEVFNVDLLKRQMGCLGD